MEEDFDLAQGREDHEANLVLQALRRQQVSSDSGRRVGGGQGNHRAGCFQGGMLALIPLTPLEELFLFYGLVLVVGAVMLFLILRDPKS